MKEGVWMYLTIIQKSIDYIEDNLKTDITAKELSEMQDFQYFIIIGCFKVRLVCRLCNI